MGVEASELDTILLRAGEDQNLDSIGVASFEGSCSNAGSWRRPSGACFKGILSINAMNNKTRHQSSDQME